MINITVRLLDEYDIRFDNRCRILVDGTDLSLPKNEPSQISSK
jgi:hypothetical protein